MKSKLKTLYQSFILEHNKNPLHFHELADATEVLDAYNPVCGDRFKVFLKLVDDRIETASFKGYGCAISKASTSVLMKRLPGCTLAEAQVLVNTFLQTIQQPESEAAQEADADFAPFSTVRDFPGREKCVSLAWDELQHFLDQPTKTDS